MKKTYHIIMGVRNQGKQMAEAEALLEMYSYYTEKIMKFNTWNVIVHKTSGFLSNKNISTEIPVNREMFDKLYQVANLLKLPIDMTFNYDTGLWYLTIKYKAQELCFTNNDN